MPIKHGGIAASRTSIWLRDHFCRSTIAPRRSRPTTWNEFLPISMPMVAMVAIDLLDMAVLHLTLAPSQHYSPVGAGARPDHSISGSQDRAGCCDAHLRRTIWIVGSFLSCPLVSHDNNSDDDIAVGSDVGFHAHLCVSHREEALGMRLAVPGRIRRVAQRPRNVRRGRLR